MKESSILTVLSGAIAALGVLSMPAWGDNPPVAAPTAVPAPATPPAAPPGPTAMSTPSMTYPLVANPNPTQVNAGPLGKVYVTGVLSALGLAQNNAPPPVCNGCNKNSLVDISNGQIFVQKTDGLWQFFLEGGGYSFPVVGVPYERSADETDATFGVLPVGYLKIAPGSGAFSLEVGKLPTLIGAEYAFTFQNTNIERGLLWNQENIVSRGVQANYATGPLTFALSWNDGYYTNKYNWITGSVAWTINSANSLAFAAGGNVGQTSPGTDITVPVQDNSSIYNLIYTHTMGAWTIEPYLQYQNIPSNTDLGISSADMWGGALLVNYAFNPMWSLPLRVEYEGSDGGTNLLYGPGSKAWSLTITPTYQDKIFFARFELSYIEADSATAGFALGSEGDSTSQARALLETGIIF